ncbi:uracil-DNA glycosylase [Spiroplasma culicicola]|uniref:Uracil-DNA glycosylase n=1 Tax=Spiroplasma culicicola AES-1 TaxID=1276246 RepID=W6A6A4_9MOLU|nr:uracil-DNA glycosylase [Spiroplasma culicicola]AHI52370.1 uracil-DNA glycosylase [Spiroplasma culicicola AES-1]
MNAIFKGIYPEWIKLFEENNILIDIQNTLDKITDFNNVFPPKENIFRIFTLIKPEDVKIVIIGQDPYHTKGSANGIAFSVSNNVKTPPSLKNIFKELKNDLNIDHFDNNDLSQWVKQGVLLINTIFTVKESQPGSHKNIGWEQIVVKILNCINKINTNIIYCLWGNYAKNLYNNLDTKSEYCIISMHPSPFSYKNGFENSKPFSKINGILNEMRIRTIDWQK